MHVDSIIWHTLVFKECLVKVGNLQAPALQVLIGGGILGDGKGRFSDKVS